MFLFVIVFLSILFVKYNFSKNPVYLYIFLFCILYLFYYEFEFDRRLSSYSRNRAMAKYKSCNANMKTIEGALELYQIENNKKNLLISVEELFSNGYLKAIPSCPGTTFRYISFLRCSEYGVPSKKQYEIIYDKDKHFVDIKCDVHGFLNADDGKYVGVPYYFRNRL